MLIMETKKELKAKANKTYYENNKNEIIQLQKEKRLCIYCNKSYPLYHMSKRNKSIKHITNVKNESCLKIQEL